MVFYDFISFRWIFLVIYNKILSFLCLQVINVFLNSHSWKLEHQVQCSFENISLIPCILVFPLFHRMMAVSSRRLACIVHHTFFFHVPLRNSYFFFPIFIALFSLNNSIHMIYTSCMCIFKLWNSIQTIFNCHKATFPCAVHPSCVYSVYT